MPYKPIRGGTIYNRKLAALTSNNRKIRTIIQTTIQKGATREEVQQAFLAITLITTHSDETVDDLHAFDDGPTDPVPQ